MRCIGIDLHKRSFTVAELHSDSSIQSCEVTLESLQSIAEFLDGLKADDRVAIEATNNSYFLYGLIKPLVAEVVIAPPKKVRLIAESNSKTDIKDAEILARLLYAGLLPGIYVPSPEVQAVRGLLGHRLNVVKERTSVKNRIHALLGSHGFSSPVSDLFGKKGRRVIEEVKKILPLHAQVELVSCIRLLDSFEEEITQLEDHLACAALSDPYGQVLMTIKGVNVIMALSISAYIVDITRFASGKKLAAYAGIVPIVRSSKDKVYHGPITKEGPPVLRWALVEVAQALVREPGPFRNLYRRKLRKKGDSEVIRGKALIACANKLARVIWKMLSEGMPYNDYNTVLYNKKLKRACKIARPYQHSLDDNWNPKVLIPSRRKPPTLSEAQSEESVRLCMIHDAMEKVRKKKGHRTQQQVA